MERINFSRIGLHIIFWLVYLPLNAMLNCAIQRQPFPDAVPEMLAGEAYSLPVKILLTYYIFYYIIPLYLERSRLRKMVGMTLLGFTVAALGYRLVLQCIIFPIVHPGETFDFFYVPGILVTYFDLFITATAALIIKMIRMHYKSLDFERQLQKEKLQSELNFLRTQTNPHFLFNTLNNLYVLAWKKSDKTADAIMMLSKIMRFVLYDCRVARIKISDETKVIQDYIELEKLRYTDRLKVTYLEDLDNPGALIAPLLLLPFVENSFKHGANSTVGDAKIDIKLLLKNNTLDFYVSNTDEKDGDKNPNSDGIGLKNVKRQLDLIYPDNYQLQIDSNNDIYTIHLTINLNEDNPS